MHAAGHRMWATAAGPILAVLGAVVLWGSSFSAMKSVVAIMDPMAVMWVRMAVAVAVLFFLRRYISFANYRRGDWKRLGLMALFLPCVYFLLEANALTLTTSSQAGVVAASLPLMVAFGAWLTLGERMSARGLFGLAVAVACVAWLTLSASPSEAASNPVLGNLLEFLAMICSAGYMLCSKNLSTRYSPLTLTAVQMCTGFVFFLPGAFSLSLPEAGLLPTLATLVYLGSAVSLGAFGLFNFGVSRIPAASASAFVNMVPVVAVLLGWLFLDEVLSAMQWIAAAGVFLGVWLSQRGSDENGADEVDETPDVSAA